MTPGRVGRARRAGRRRGVGLAWLGVAALAGTGCGVGVHSGQHPPDWPDWAYGLLAPLAPGARVAPPCPPTARPIECAYPGEPVADDGIRRSLPDTELMFTRNEAHYGYGPADWYPNDHPEMPAIVAYGNEAEGVRACALCHYPNGQGKMENGHVAGLPAEYILQQLEAFASGARRSADRRKANTNEMAMIAARLTAAQKRQAAEYYASIAYRPMVRVVEAEAAPQVRVTVNGLMLPVPDAPPVPLGQRIVEVPEDPQRTEMMRDPRGGFVAYVPPGSLAKGEALVQTGGEGKTIQCGICHGRDQMGLGGVPGIGGRTAGYTMRQLWDMRQGTRHSPLMAPVVANLTAEDMLNIS
ncbi:MAG: c-type cytochrome, partial [Rhodospirillaceae bacterium]|nr:c-type cytochrome [Rhodospirillaceae bacterium]